MAFCFRAAPESVEEAEEPPGRVNVEWAELIPDGHQLGHREEQDGLEERVRLQLCLGNVGYVALVRLGCAQSQEDKWRVKCGDRSVQQVQFNNMF